jgi:hypothetical protein
MRREMGTLPVEVADADWEWIVSNPETISIQPGRRITRAWSPSVY